MLYPKVDMEFKKTMKEIHKQFIKLYMSGLSRRRTCEELGISEGIGCYVLKKYNIEKRPSGFQKGNRLGSKFKPVHTTPDSRKCLYCGNDFTIVYESGKHIDLDKKFCSKKCADIYHGLSIRKEKHWNWQGGKPRSRYGTNYREYKNWRISVFKRDRYKCQDCGSDKNIRAHHIKTWKEFPELRYEVSNGLTLCEECHFKLHRKHKRNS